jgi:hypothetical protein
MLSFAVSAAEVCLVESSLAARMWDGTTVRVKIADNDVESLRTDMTVPIIALETHGANCFYHSMSINPGRFNASKLLPDGVDAFYDTENDVAVARVSHFNSRASGSLGASIPAPRVVKMALERKGAVRCVTVPDELSMQTLLRLAGMSHVFIDQ